MSREKIVNYKEKRKRKNPELELIGTILLSILAWLILVLPYHK